MPNKINIISAILTKLVKCQRLLCLIPIRVGEASGIVAGVGKHAEEAEENLLINNSHVFPLPTLFSPLIISESIDMEKFINIVEKISNQNV